MSDRQYQVAVVIVIPAKAGIQECLGRLDSRLRGNDVFMLLCAPQGHEDFI